MTVIAEELGELYNKLNPLIKEVKKDSLTLEIRKYSYFIILSNGTVIKNGVHLSEELREYFEIDR